MTTKPNPLTPPLAQKPGDHIQWGNLHGSALALTLSHAIRDSTDRPLLIIVPDNLSVASLREEITFFLPDNTDRRLLSFADWETLPYDRFSPHQDIISSRLKTLNHLSHKTHAAVITSATTLMQQIVPPSFLAGHAFFLDVGDQLKPELLAKQLTQNGYRHVAQVYEHGEFAIRGAIIDLFPMGHPTPYRIELFDNEVETIRTFDPDTQRSSHQVDSIHLLPAKEFPTDEHAIALFRSQFRDTFSGNPTECPIYQDVSQGVFTPGIEYYLPLFVEHTATLFDYLPDNTLIISSFDLKSALEAYWAEIQTRFAQRQHDVTHPILSPTALFTEPNKLLNTLKSFSRIHIPSEPIAHNPPAGKFNFDIDALPDVSLSHAKDTPLHLLKNFIGAHPGRLLFCTDSAGRRESLLNLLRGINLQPTTIDNWRAFTHSKNNCSITIGRIRKGFILPNNNLAIITEADILGAQVMQRRLRKRSAQPADPDSAIYNLGELNVGDPVVHAEHGIGRYLGLEIITINHQTSEFLSLAYANDDKLFVPITSLHLISSYSGAGVDNAPLSRLGSGQWEKAKQKAAKRVHDVAAELLAIYAKRAAKKGFAFSAPDKQYYEFAASFPFEETPDQETAINHILNDMTKDTPMDRLVCGDVGFGKTEVAMRAAFLAVNNNKQVCFLVPTTLLAQQHYETLQDRFANLPIKIHMLSRFRNMKEQQNTIDQLKTGHVDIVVGTHKLIQEKIQFKHLGLIIIDEEHRFGVRQKERLKAMRTEVDILTLTATPIPRTLNMALSSIRDLSIIATPPAKRLSIKSFMHEYDEPLIKESIERELLRGGQVYFLHNDVSTIKNMADKIQSLSPNARIAIGHGQMREMELEKVMSDFYHHRSNVLVCTTIIETGIDIPNANTIIINRADKFGLAQLHQLRGRVGRSHHQAYAYLFIPSHKTLTKEAQLRLDAIVTHDELGIGFTLAMHDLEIRGAGALLGDEQSGNIQEIGFSLYNEMLEHAVNAIKQGKDVDLTNPLTVTADINLHITTLIPETYIPDVHTRLQYYKRLANAKNDETLGDLQAEMVDCFGLLPDPLKHLFNITTIKLIATHLGIAKIEMNRQSGRIDFSSSTNINPGKLIKLIQTQSDKYQLNGPTRLRISIPTETAEQRFDLIDRVLASLM